MLVSSADPATGLTGRLAPVHILLAVQSLVVVLLSINRLSTLTSDYVASNQFLRWVDLNNMLVLPLISVLAFYLLKRQIEYDAPARGGGWHLVLNLAFIAGVYILAASYGNHEVTNYLHARFCMGGDADTTLCRIIIFNDDDFSHWVFFTGFVLINGALMLLQTLFPYRPYRGRLTPGDVVLLIVNGLFIAVAVFANLAFETIGLDLYVVLLLAVLAVGLLWRRGAQPLLIYYAAAYSVGFLATGLFSAM